MLEPYAEKLIQRVVGMAKDGDMAALKLCLDRLYAPLRPNGRNITIDAFDSCSGLSDRGEIVLANVASGHITSAEASDLMPAISTQARIIEVDELEAWMVIQIVLVSPEDVKECQYHWIRKESERWCRFGAHEFY